MANKIPRIGVGVWIKKDGKVLLAKRIGAHGQNTWAPPGGHLEYGESMEDCVRREVHEETGLEVTNIKRAVYTEDVFKNEDKHYITHYFTCDWQSGQPKIMEPDKCEKWNWFEWDKMPKPRFLPVRHLYDSGYDPFQKDYNNPAPVAGVYPIKDGKVLLSRRGIEPRKGTWDNVGGFLNGLEHPEEAAKREAMEEMGVEVEIVDLLGIYKDMYKPGKPVVATIYIAKIIGDKEPKAQDDIEAVEWVDIDNAHELEFGYEKVLHSIHDLQRWYAKNKDKLK